MLEQFWVQAAGASRIGNSLDQVLFVLVAYRLLGPGSGNGGCTAMVSAQPLADLLGRGCRLRRKKGKSTSCIAVMTTAETQAGGLRSPVGRWRGPVSTASTTCCFMI